MASALAITSGPQTYGAADSIVPASAIDRDAGYRAIDTIHSSIDWSHHSAPVKMLSSDAAPFLIVYSYRFLKTSNFYLKH